jgi:hypothetical protein
MELNAVRVGLDLKAANVKDSLRTQCILKHTIDQANADSIVADWVHKRLEERLDWRVDELTLRVDQITLAVNRLTRQLNKRQ